MIEVAAAVIVENGNVLLGSRPADKPPAGWEFPGGKKELNETLFDAVKRELIEELAMEIIPHKELFVTRHEHLEIHFILCSRKPDSHPCPKEKQEWKWEKISETPPTGLLENDSVFWKFLYKHKINL